MGVLYTCVHVLLSLGSSVNTAVSTGESQSRGGECESLVIRACEQGGKHVDAPHQRSNIIHVTNKTPCKKQQYTSMIFQS